MFTKKLPQYDDHCLIPYRGDLYRITRIHKGIAELTDTEYCHGCREHHEEFLELTDSFCKRYSDGQFHNLTRRYCDDTGTVHPLQ